MNKNANPADVRCLTRTSWKVFSLKCLNQQLIGLLGMKKVSEKAGHNSVVQPTAEGAAGGKVTEFALL